MTTNFEELLALFRDYVRSLKDKRVADFIAPLDWSMPQRSLRPHGLQSSSLLDRITNTASKNAQPLTTLLAKNRDNLHWGQTYTAADFGQGFVDNYGWLEVFGTRGHFENDAIAGGLLILGPNITYPDHHHVAEEIYVPLTGGTLWRKGEGDFIQRSADEIIHHPSNVNHAMKTGSEPLLALYLWRGGPLAVRPTVTNGQG